MIISQSNLYINSILIIVRPKAAAEDNMRFPRGYILHPLGKESSRTNFLLLVPWPWGDDIQAEWYKNEFPDDGELFVFSPPQA